MHWVGGGGEKPYCRHAPQGEALQVGVTQCDKDKAQAFSQQGLRSLFVLLQIFVTPRKWPPRLRPASSVSSLLLQSSDNLLRERTPILIVPFHIFQVFDSWKFRESRETCGDAFVFYNVCDDRVRFTEQLPPSLTPLVCSK